MARRGDKNTEVRTGYAAIQLARALVTTRDHGDPETRERARARVDRWSQVFLGMLDGSLRVGSRTPLKEVPAWATLEVVTGGFATGALLAGGPLRDHERELITRLPPASDAAERLRLNSYFLSEDGLAELRRVLAEGRYDVAVPEEGALPVVAWLLDQGHDDKARDLLSEIGPFFPRLRFYPAPTEQRREFGSRVHLRTAGEAAESLRAIRENQRVAAQREAIDVWAPLYDRMVSLFAETVTGKLPSVVVGENGKPVRDERGSYAIAGGWPCQKYPPGWRERARGLVEEARRLRIGNPRCGSLDRTQGSLGGLYSFLQIAAQSGGTLQGVDVGKIRLLLARSLTKRGEPSERSYLEYRAAQKVQVTLPLHVDIAKVLIQRLRNQAPQEGIDAVDPLLVPISAEEADRYRLPEGTPVPAGLRRKVLRSGNETIEALVDLGVITSGDTIARVAPQIVASLRSAGIVDPVLRRLYRAIYQAFRGRRSLLLLDLEHQVRLEELPWIRSIEHFRTEDLASREVAALALEDLSALALTSFPWAILPNKLLQELYALAQGADTEIPLVDELAADIFMGKFSEKFLRAAKIAADLLTGTLYERYYGIDYAAIAQIDDASKHRFGPPTSKAFSALCAHRAGKKWRDFRVAMNGMVIEQQQILTTQNLAALFVAAGLTQRLRPRLRELAERTYTWVLGRHQTAIKGRPSQLRMIKNTAYAWRQMIFYLSLLDPIEQAGFSSWGGEILGQQPGDIPKRFEPALAGLKRAIDGRPPEPAFAAIRSPQPRIFLGWTTDRHWLLPPD